MEALPKRSLILPCILALLVVSESLSSALPSGDKFSRAEVEKAMLSGATYLSTATWTAEGASRSDYHLQQGEWIPYEPAWHTGQAILGMLKVWEALGGSTSGPAWLLQEAQRGGSWWLSLRMSPPAFPPNTTGMIDGRALGEEPPVNKFVVLSTVTDGSHGIFLLAQALKANRSAFDVYNTTLVEATDWMIRNMMVPQSLSSEVMFYDSLDPQTGQVMTHFSPFWNTSTPTLDQVARPNNEGYVWFDAYQLTGSQHFLQVFYRVCDTLVKTADSDGLWMQFMPNDAASGEVHARFNLWYAESLLVAYEHSKNQQYLEVANRTLSTYKRFISDTGTFYYKNYINNGVHTFRRDSICGSGASFTALLMIKIQELTQWTCYEPVIQAVFTWVMTNRFSEDHPDPNLRGAFLETRSHQAWSNIVMEDIYVRDIATSFGIRFLAAYTEAYL